MAHLSPIENIPSLGAGDRDHAIYLIKNHSQDIKADRNLGINFHMEEPGRPGYTYAGFAAGKDSDVITWKGKETPKDASMAVAGWLIAPFHRFSMLNPHLREAGYGEYCHDGACAAALNLSAGSRIAAYHRFYSGGGLTDQASNTTVFDTPVEFPPDGSVLKLYEFPGGEWPDPLSSCPGYEPPTGLPISVQIGTWVKTRLSAYSVTENGKPVAVCGIDSTNYKNPDMLTQRDGRGGLRFFGAVILMPRKPLTPGASYKVSATVNGQKYDWSFKVAGIDQILR